jgi:hypothetical protein
MYRYSVSTVGDPRCASSESTEFGLSKHNVGYGPNQCLAIERIEAPTKGFAYAQGVDQYSEFPDITRMEKEIWRLEDKKVVASNRQYVFTSLFSNLVGFAAGGGNPSAYCDAPDVVNQQWRSFLWRALHDESKPSEVPQ